LKKGENEKKNKRKKERKNEGEKKPRMEREREGMEGRLALENQQRGEQPAAASSDKHPSMGGKERERHGWKRTSATSCSRSGILAPSPLLPVPHFPPLCLSSRSYSSPRKHGIIKEVPFLPSGCIFSGSSLRGLVLRHVHRTKQAAAGGEGQRSSAQLCANQGLLGKSNQQSNTWRKADAHVVDGLAEGSLSVVYVSLIRM
jgi:hypothetical protein